MPMLMGSVYEFFVFVFGFIPVLVPRGETNKKKPTGRIVFRTGGNIWILWVRLRAWGIIKRTAGQKHTCISSHTLLSCPPPSFVPARSGQLRRPDTLVTERSVRFRFGDGGASAVAALSSPLPSRLVPSGHVHSLPPPHHPKTPSPRRCWRYRTACYSGARARAPRTGRR